LGDQHRAGRELGAGIVARGEQAQRFASAPVRFEEPGRRVLFVEVEEFRVTGAAGELEAGRHARRDDRGRVEGGVGELGAQQQADRLGERRRVRRDFPPEDVERELECEAGAIATVPSSGRVGARVAGTLAVPSAA
jgi:hypothetical protein